MFEARGRRRLILAPAPQEGARNTGRAMRPQSRAQMRFWHTSVVTTVTPEASGVPHAVVLTAYFVRNPRRANLSNPPLRGKAMPRGNTTSASPLRRGRHRRSVHEQAHTRHGESNATASTASRPAIRDDRVSPLSRGRDKYDYNPSPENVKMGMSNNNAETGARHRP